MHIVYYLTMDTFLKNLYYDPKTGYVSAQKLFEKARDIDPTITLKDVKEWYSNQIDIQRFQDQRSKFDQFKITSHNPNSWQMDLTFFKKKTILTAININSRIGYANLIKNKQAGSILKALRHFLRNHIVDVLTTDNGREFMNNVVQKYLMERNIEHFNNEPGDHNTMGKIERFNRTLKQRLIKVDSPITQTLLKDVIFNYNNTIHSALGATPEEMKGEVVENDIRHNQELNMRVGDSFNVGDHVIYKLKPRTFSKETVKWSKTVYEIAGMDGYRVQIRSKNNHTLYKPHNELKIVQEDATEAPIENNQVWEVETILSHKKMRNNKLKYLVKWKDFDEPTWEPQDNLRLINKNKMSKLEEEYFNDSR